MFKRSLLLIFTLILCFGLFACKSNEEQKQSDADTTVPPVDTPTEPTPTLPTPSLPNVGDDYGEVITNINNNISYDSETHAPYEIYPVPHDINYTNQYYYVPQQVNIVFESGIDEPTKNHMYEVLAMKDMNAKPSNVVSSGKNVLVGIYDSNEVVDNAVSGVDTTLFTKIDAYYLSIDANNITILGKDTDACYYAITTLEWIFEQTNNTIRGLVIEDYSDTYYRGFIEGYYGIPWTTDERVELMEYASKVKSNIYI